MQNQYLAGRLLRQPVETLIGVIDYHGFLAKT
jgi:hypothetical protein